jgi:RNA polymerase sigma-70 factor (ECF subfamily)
VRQAARRTERRTVAGATLRAPTTAAEPVNEAPSQATRRGSWEDMQRDWNDADDTVLVVAIGRWREEALAEAYRRHGGSVYALAKHVLHNAAQAEEITQDVFLRLWEHPERFEPGRGTLRSYLLVQTHGRAVDRLRQDTARRERQFRDARLTARGGYNLEEEITDLVMAERVKEAVAALDSNERRAIELAYFAGHTYREVAEMLQEPEGTVKSRIRSGLRRMRSLLLHCPAEEGR